MLNKLIAFIKRYRLLEPGDTVVCGVSGGADSIALLSALSMLSERLGIELCAAHFNHGLRGEESDRDEAFVRDFCNGYGIRLFVGSSQVIPGKKGLEAAARDARYDFLKSLPGKIATAHTANDNAETVLMHMVRGSGLRGLGGIAPKSDRLIRPMLSVTRQDVLAFLQEYGIPYVEDSSNGSDQFLRNRLRHHVMPLLEQENPSFAENTSAMALRLREDERQLTEQVLVTNDVERLQNMSEAGRSRALAAFLQQCGVWEPEAEHIAQVEKLVFSQKPSASVNLPNGITVAREYGILTLKQESPVIETRQLVCPGVTKIPEIGMQVRCEYADKPKEGGYFVAPEGALVLRHRVEGDMLRLPGGTKRLKKLFIDRKIPAAKRLGIPVIADDLGVLCVYGIGADTQRIPADDLGVMIYFEEI